MNNKTIALLSTGFVLGLLFAPAPGHKTRRDCMTAYYKICAKLNKWFSKDSDIDFDLEALKQEIIEIEDHISLQAKIKLNQLINKVENKS